MLGFEKHLSKVADYCGFKENGERGLDPMKELQKAINFETGGASPLADCLLYDYFDDKTNIAFNKGSLGFFVEINSLVGSDSSIEKNLTLFFNDELPKDGCLQFLVIASNNIEPILKRWEEGRQYGGEELKRLTYYRRHFIENAARDYTNAQDGRLARNFRLFVSFSCPDKGEITLDKTLKFKNKLYNKLKAENFQPRLCDGAELIDIAGEILQMSLAKKEPAKYDILNDISSQILKNNDSTICDDKIVHNDSGLVSKIFTPTELPDGFSLVEMINLLGDEYKAIPGRFIICYSLANNIGVKGASSIIAGGDRVISASTKAYTQTDLVAKEEASKWIQVKAIHKKGEIFLRESMLVMITAPSSDIETAEEVIKSLYNAHDWKLAICSKIQRVASLAMLPMMASSYIGMLQFFKLTRYALSGDVVAKLPLQGEWKGVPTSGVLLMGRCGQLFLFDPFHRVGGGSARQAHEAVSSRTDKAEEAFKDLTSARYQEKFNEIKSEGNKISYSGNVSDFADASKIDSSIGGKRDEFARANNINTDRKGVEQEITDKGSRIKDLHDTKYNANQGEYKKTEGELTKSQEGRLETMDKYEKDRIGRDEASTAFGKLGGLGRPAEKTNYDDELGDPIGKPYEPKAVKHNWETGNGDPLTKEQESRYNFKPKGQYVDPKKK